MASVISSESAIFERVVTPDEPSLPIEAARYLLALGFSGQDKERMRFLSAKARDGSLNSAEEEEIASYERVGHFLAILQSKARTILRQAGQGAD